MLLSDLNSLRKALRSAAAATTDHSRYSDGVDADIERMYAESPQLSEWPVVYNFDNFYKVEKEEPASADSKPLTALWSVNAEFAMPDFTPKPPSDMTAPSTVSALSKMFDESSTGRSIGKPKLNGIPITIYLPDYSSIRVSVKEQCTFGELITQVLCEHEQQHLLPSLDYDEPDNYEVRIHEGDGEPDRDFAAFEPDKTLKQYDLDEYCLCLIEERGGEYRIRGDRYSGNQHSVNLFQSIDVSTKPDRGRDRHDSSASSPGLSKLGSSGYIHDPSSKRLPAFDSTAFEQSGKSDQRDYVMDDYETVETATIRFPNGQQVEVPYDHTTTLREMLPLVAKLHPLKKLRLHTDEYVFVISQQDQKRLQYTSSKMDINARICAIGTTFFELQKKTYADSMRAKAKIPPPVEYGAPANRPSEAVFTETTVNAYQEWNVVKKNRFGRRQERVFGVDGKKVYNGKRGTLGKGTAQRVQRAEREITTIVNVEILPTDDKTFRITWRDDRDLYDIEYTFDTSRECAEAVAKIRYIRNRDVAAGGRPSLAKR